MTNEERDIISRFVARVGGAPQGGAFAGSPGAPPAALPPIDPEADGFISEQFQRYPEARYRVTQMAFVQEAALVEAQNRIRRLEWELQQAQQQAQHAAQQPQQRGGLFSGLFGGGQRQAPPPGQGAQQGYGQQGGYAPPPPQYAPPPPQYPPNYNPAMLRSGGSGFLGSALGTAAGVAGGMVAANALMDLFGGHHGGYGGGMGGFGAPGFAPTETTIVNNYGDAAGGADPWANVSNTDSGADQGQGDAGGGDPWGNVSNQDSGYQNNPFDQGNMDPGGDQGGGWDDPSGGGGGWDDTSNT